LEVVISHESLSTLFNKFFGELPESKKNFREVKSGFILLESSFYFREVLTKNQISPKNLLNSVLSHKIWILLLSLKTRQHTAKLLRIKTLLKLLTTYYLKTYDSHSFSPAFTATFTKFSAGGTGQV
jgi:hypothetical protein